MLSSRSFWLTAFFAASGRTRCRFALAVSHRASAWARAPLARPRRPGRCAGRSRRGPAPSARVPFPVILLHQVAGHLGLDRRVHQPVGRSDPTPSRPGRPSGSPPIQRRPGAAAPPSPPCRTRPREAAPGRTRRGRNAEGTGQGSASHSRENHRPSCYRIFVM